ncbi:valine--tRNA ligase [Desulfovirgula thermocuniculi]|uniref:valine--tRNA ligase n=1 Tax=Desulfovirgula thermocuniculi TaxID=348842 RepID=UPI00040CC9AE|nr:valine--tRNA ligase [Desulfovirgula thermocuniculi]
MARTDMPTAYNPRDVEEKWYRYWEENKFFHSEVDPSRVPYTIVMPPPNVTGQLHMGHALDNTLQDVLIRWRRMQGYNVLWLPGTDHAGIATQAKVEEQLAREGLSKYDLGREKFLERVWAWKEEYGGRITRQLRRLGASCDWDRERFTMDEGCSAAVREFFLRLYEKGLIYRDYYIVNWCPRCQTVISDIEVEHLEKPGQLYYIKYPAREGGDYLVVATTRPETMLGDVAVAVHPADDRYRHMVGKVLVLPLVGREIPVIADEYVDPSFGTGAVKITPAHDPHDFEVARRHGLPQIKVMNEHAVMDGEAGPYRGLDRWECRKAVLRDLKEQGYLLKVEDYTHAVGHCYRCETVIEPMISRQWFVRMKPLAEPAIAAVKEGRIRFVPERFTKIYLHWMENIRDWCISRQLWWGHRIPVWYCQDCGETMAERETPEKCARCASPRLEQDPDVLDTWFSSGLWPFSTLGWPQKTRDLEYYYPTTVLVTGRDIIFFWVARMITSGLFAMEEVPFKEVFIHGLVLDALGRKMSKSLGNGVDPIEVIESHGADSLRFMLVTGNTPGSDLRFHFERLDGARNFANKIWNASRFVLMNLDGYRPEEAPGPEAYTLADRWILSRYARCVRAVTESLEAYELGEAARAIYDFLWDEFCDWYIELAKPRLYHPREPRDRQLAQHVLARVLKGALELLHPFMPFITEEIWQRLPHRGRTIMLAPWPVYQPELVDEGAEAAMELLMEVTRAIRHIRSEMNVPPGKTATAVLVAEEEGARELLAGWRHYVEGLARCRVELRAACDAPPPQSAHGVARGVKIYVPLAGLIDINREASRLEKELAAVEKELARVKGKLASEAFLTKAAPDVVEKERAKEKDLSARAASLRQRLAVLRG